MGSDDHAFMQQTRAYELTVYETTQFKDGLAVQTLIGHLQILSHGFGACILLLHALQLGILLIILDTAYSLYYHRHHNDTYYGKRIGACVTVGYIGIASTHLTERLFGSTQSRSIGNGTAQHAHQHGETVGVGAVKQEQIGTYRYHDIEEYHKYSQTVHLYSALGE